MYLFIGIQILLVLTLLVVASGKNIKAFYLSALAITVNDPVPAYAAKTAAASDILDNPRYQGAVDAVNIVSNVMDQFFQFFISIAAYFIISAAILREVLAALYVTFPKLFDNIHEAQLWINGFFDGAMAVNVGGGRQIKIGSFIAWILSFIPDVKELTDFADGEISVKAYFLKGIPRMISLIMLGFIIYNGYYRDLALKTMELGCEWIQRFIINVDPVETWDRITNSWGSPVSSYDNDDSDRGKLIKDISSECYHAVISKYTDIQGKEAKTNLSTSIEDIITSNIDTCAAYLNAEDWESAYQIDLVYSDPNLANIEKTDEESCTKAWKIAMTELSIDSKIENGDPYYLRIIVRFTKIHHGVAKVGQLSNVQFDIPYTNWRTSNGETTISGISDMSRLLFSNNPTVGGFQVTKTSDGFKVAGDLSATDYEVSGITYYIDGKNHTIKKIHKSTDQKLQLEDTNGTVSAWEYGKAPIVTEEGKKESKDSVETANDNNNKNKTKSSSDN